MTTPVNDQAVVKKLIRQLARKKITVAMGGFSAERVISLKTGQGVQQVLQEHGLMASGLDIRQPGDLQQLARFRPDVVMLCLHGPFGEDGRIQGFLEWMGIPYTGCGMLASALAMNKYQAKRLLQQAGLPVAPGWLLDPQARKVPLAARLPLVVKPNAQGSALGVSIVRKRTGLDLAVRQARRYGAEILVEKFCPGMEISVGVFIDRPLPVIEIVPKNEFYNFEAKYTPGMSEHIIPARLPKASLRRAQQLAGAAFMALGCRGISRIDMIVGPRQEFTILEVNTMPGLTSTSLFPDAARAAGISFSQVVLRLIIDALAPR